MYNIACNIHNKDVINYNQRIESYKMSLVDLYYINNLVNVFHGTGILHDYGHVIYIGHILITHLYVPSNPSHYGFKMT